MSQDDGIVHLGYLPEDRVCVKLSDDVQKEMVEIALNFTNNSPYKLAGILGVYPVNIYDFKKSRFGSITLSFVEKLSKFLEKHGFKEFSLDNLEQNLELIKAKFVGNPIFNPKFPMNFNCKEGAQVVAAIMFDGGITSRGYPFYTNNEEVLVEKMIKNVKNIVGEIEYNKRTHNLHSETIQLEFPKILGYILMSGLDIIPGRKIFNNPFIPEFILRNKGLYKSFLRQAYDDKGYVFKGDTNGQGKSIQLPQYNSENQVPERLKQLKELTERSGVRVNGPFGPMDIHRTKEGYTSYGFAIQVSHQLDLKAFAEKINFSLKRKRKDLEGLLKTYSSKYISRPRFKRGTKFDKVLRACKELKLEGKKITNKNIADKLNRDDNYIAELTLKLEKKGKLKVVKPKLAIKGFASGFEGREFELVK